MCTPKIQLIRPSCSVLYHIGSAQCLLVTVAMATILPQPIRILCTHYAKLVHNYKLN